MMFPTLRLIRTLKDAGYSVDKVEPRDSDIIPSKWVVIRDNTVVAELKKYSLAQAPAIDIYDTPRREELTDLSKGYHSGLRIIGEAAPTSYTKRGLFCDKTIDLKPKATEAQ